MKLSELLKNYKKEKTEIKSERADLIKQFTEILDSDRIKNKYKPLGAKYYAIKMSHLSTQDLYWFLSYCKDAKNFSSTWWFSLRI